MLLENEYIKVKWANKTRRYYENKGYVFTKYGEEFDCKVMDIPSYSRNKVPCICDCCKKLFYKSREKVKHNYDFCSPSCHATFQHSLTYNDRKKSAFDRLKNFCNEKNYTLLTQENEYKNIFTPVKYKCPIHGLQISTVDRMISGHGCIGCQYDIIRHTYEELEENVNSYNNNKLLNVYTIDGLYGKRYELSIKCGICGNTFNISYSSYMKSIHKKCPTCSKSASGYEIIIRDILDKNNINYKSEYSFNDCKDVLPLHFDFYLFDYNLCIEYDGEYHYMPLKISKSDTEKDIQARYEKIQRHDKIKNDYCLSHNINLLRIPYWEKDNIESIILNKIKEINNSDKRYSLVS